MTHKANLAALLAAAMLLPGVAASQQGSDDGDHPSLERAMEIFSLAGRSSDSFPYYLQLLRIDRGSDDYSGQFAATLAAELGLYEQAIAEFPQPPYASEGLAPLPATDARVANAVDVIASKAKDRRIVVINEAHHVGQTRVLFLELLPRLRAMGFTHYCAETLNIDAVPKLQKRGYPLRGDGGYSKEPVFGEVVRTATRLGYTLCGYDFSGKTQQERETGQALNLAAVLRDDPDARILVHAGYNHARKTRPNYAPMAGELERLTGIEPLTVDQAALRPDIPATREIAAYRTLSRRLGEAERASVFVDADGTPWSLEPESYDASVILPALPSSHGRAGWLWAIPGRQVVTAYDADCMGRYPCAIEARHAGESGDAVPADVVVHRKAGETAPALALAPGAYRLRTVAPDGSTVREADLAVAPKEESP